MKITYNISEQTTVIGDKPETIEKGETLNLTLQANTGFKFDPVPVVAIRTSSFQYINTNFQIDSTGKNATISYHLSQLKKAGLIFEEKKKNFIFYQLNASVFEEIMLWISQFGGNNNEKEN